MSFLRELFNILSIFTFENAGLILLFVLLSLLVNTVMLGWILRLSYRLLKANLKRRNTMEIERAAKIAHEVNRAFCSRLGDNSQPPWEEAPDWQKQSAISGITLHWKALSEGRTLPPSASHESWLAEKERTGWKYGPVKNAETKEHPCFVPYEQLPADQQTKDYLFGAVAHATWAIGC